MVIERGAAEGAGGGVEVQPGWQGAATGQLGAVREGVAHIDIGKRIGCELKVEGCVFGGVLVGHWVGHRGYHVVAGNHNAIAKQVGNQDDGIRPRVPVFQHPEVVDGAVGGRRSILVHEQGQCCTVGGAHGHRKAGVGRDVHIRCVCQCVAGRALPLQKNPVGHDVVVRADQGQEVGASHHQHARGDVVSGAGHGGHRHIAHRDAIAGRVCNHHGRICACCPVFSGNQVVSGCAGGAGAVFVQDQVGA